MATSAEQVTGTRNEHYDLVSILYHTLLRGEVIYPRPDSRVFVQGICRIPSCGVALSFASRQLCQGHYQRWKSVGRRG